MPETYIVTVCLAGDFRPQSDELRRLEKQIDGVHGRTAMKVCSSDSWEDSDIEKTTVFFGWPSDQMLGRMPNLKWVHLPSAGSDAFVEHPVLMNRISLTTSSGVFGVAGAEHALSLLLALARDLRFHIETTQNRHWAKHRDSFEIFESTIGVFGLGNIGSEISRRLHCMGAKVIGIRRQISVEKPDYLSELRSFDDAEETLPLCDAVILALPDTKLTRGFLSSDRIARMKPGALLVNVGRGSSVDQNAVTRALEDGQLGGAGLDVTDPEPLPPEDPLWQAPNIIITSHSMNVFTRKDERRFEIFMENFTRFVEGRPLRNLVDHSRGY